MGERREPKPGRWASTPGVFRLRVLSPAEELFRGVWTSIPRVPQSASSEECWELKFTALKGAEVEKQEENPS